MEVRLVSFFHLTKLYQSPKHAYNNSCEKSRCAVDILWELETSWSCRKLLKLCHRLLSRFDKCQIRYPRFNLLLSLLIVKKMNRLRISAVKLHSIDAPLERLSSEYMEKVRWLARVVNPSLILAILEPRMTVNQLMFFFERRQGKIIKKKKNNFETNLTCIQCFHWTRCMIKAFWKKNTISMLLYKAYIGL